MRVAIMQPTYLPWLGYFDLIDQVDRFVFLDNVQFEKRSWQQRNRIKGPTGLEMLSVPVKVHGHFDQRVDEAAIADLRFWKLHLKAIELRYRRAPFFKQSFGSLEALFEAGVPERVGELNCALIEFMARALGVRVPPFLRASQLEVTGKRSERLAASCEHLGGREYLSPMGSCEYLLAERRSFEVRDVAVRLQDYRHPRYEQLFPPFVEYASALDLLFNAGPRSAEIIRSGHSEIPLEHAHALRAEVA